MSPAAATRFSLVRKLKVAQAFGCKIEKGGSEAPGLLQKMQPFPVEQRMPFPLPIPGHPEAWWRGGGLPAATTLPSTGALPVHSPPRTPPHRVLHLHSDPALPHLLQHGGVEPLHPVSRAQHQDLCNQDMTAGKGGQGRALAASAQTCPSCPAAPLQPPSRGMRGSSPFPQNAGRALRGGPGPRGAAGPRQRGTAQGPAGSGCAGAGPRPPHVPIRGSSSRNSDRLSCEISL